MKEIRVPGVFWVILLVLLLTVVRTAVDQYGIEPVYFDLAVVAVMAILKAMNLGTQEIDQLLGIIRKLQIPVGGAGVTPLKAADHKVLDRAPSHKLMRWLVG